MPKTIRRMQLQPRRRDRDEGGADDAASQQMMAILMQAMVQGGFGLQRERIAGKTSRDVAATQRAGGMERQQEQSRGLKAAEAERGAWGVKAVEERGKQDRITKEMVDGLERTIRSEKWGIESVKDLSKYLGESGNPMVQVDMALKLNDEFQRAKDIRTVAANDLRRLLLMSSQNLTRQQINEMELNNTKDKLETLHQLKQMEGEFTSRAQAGALQLRATYADRHIPDGSSEPTTYTELMGLLDKGIFKRNGGAVDLLAGAKDKGTSPSVSDILKSYDHGGAGIEGVQSDERVLRLMGDQLGKWIQAEPDAYPTGHPIHEDRRKLLMMSISVGDWDGGRRLHIAEADAEWAEGGSEVDKFTGLPRSLRRAVGVGSYFMSDPGFREEALSNMGPAFQTQAIKDEVTKWWADQFELGPDGQESPFYESFKARQTRNLQEWAGDYQHMVSDKVEEHVNEIYVERTLAWQRGLMMKATPLLEMVKANPTIPEGVKKALISGVMTEIGEISGEVPRDTAHAMELLAEQSVNKEDLSNLQTLEAGIYAEGKLLTEKHRGQRLEETVRLLNEKAMQLSQPEKPAAKAAVAGIPQDPAGPDPGEMEAQRSQEAAAQKAAQDLEYRTPMTSGLWPDTKDGSYFWDNLRISDFESGERADAQGRYQAAMKALGAPPPRDRDAEAAVRNQAILDSLRIPEFQEDVDPYLELEAAPRKRVVTGE